MLLECPTLAWSFSWIITKRSTSMGLGISFWRYGIANKIPHSLLILCLGSARSAPENPPSSSASTLSFGAFSGFCSITHSERLGVYLRKQPCSINNTAQQSNWNNEAQNQFGVNRVRWVRIWQPFPQIGSSFAVTSIFVNFVEKFLLEFFSQRWRELELWNFFRADMKGKRR